MKDSVPDVLQSTSSLICFLSIFQLSTLPHFLDQQNSITSNRVVLNMTKSHQLQIRCCLPLFHNFKWFNMKAVLVHHPATQKEVNELLAKGPTEPSTGGASFLV